MFPPIYTSVDGNVCWDELTGGSETSPVVHLISHPGRHYYQDFLKIGVSGPSSSLIYAGDLSPRRSGFFWERAIHCIITRTEGNLTSSRQTLLSRFYVKSAYQDLLVPLYMRVTCPRRWDDTPALVRFLIHDGVSGPSSSIYIHGYLVPAAAARNFLLNWPFPWSGKLKGAI